MNGHNKWTPEEREQLTQELLELHFGCHEQPEELEQRLVNEPALRELQAEVLSQAQVLEEAVHPELEPLDLPEGKNSEGKEPVAAPHLAIASRRPRWWHLPLGRIAAVAAAGLLAALGFLGWERIAQGRIGTYMADHLHLTVSAPKAVPAGAPWSFTAQTNDLAGNTVNCRVRWQAFDQNNVVLAAGEAPTVEGNATVSLAANLAVPKRVEVIATNTTDEARQVFPISTAEAGPLVHVSTDRRVYRPGERIYVRTVVLDRVTRLPLKRMTNMYAQLLDAKDSVVVTDNDNLAPAGVGSFALVVPTNSAGGAHKIKVASRAGLFAEETAEIVVRAFRNPQLRKDIVLNRKSYAPGARGSAQVTAIRLGDNSPSSSATARGALIIDGTEVWHEERNLGANGSTTFRFEVPKDVDKGAARFVAKITDGGVIETEIKPFVVPTGKLDVTAFPEGGDLIAGVENGLYLECTDTLGRPIDTAGEIIDASERRIVSFRTAHQGRARLSFVPEEGTTYKVRLAGKSETYELPKVRKDGIALRLIGDDIAANAPLRMAVAGRGNGPWVLGVFCRGVLVGQTTLRAKDGDLQTTGELELPATASGVLRATVFDRNLKPIAERLVRRHTKQRLEVELTAAAAVLSPGDRQTIKVKTMDENGKYTSAVVGLNCTDLAATQQATEPRVSLADHAMLFGDVKQLEDLGDFFLGNAAGGRNVDLLLGTRGWRRFIWRNDAAAQKAIAAAGNAGVGILTREGFSQTPQVISNLQAANAPLAQLSNSRYTATQQLRMVIGVAIGLLLMVLLAEGIAKLLRHASMSQNVALRGTLSLAGAALLLIGGVYVTTGGLADSAPKATMEMTTADAMPTDFAGAGQFEQLLEPSIDPGLTHGDPFFTSNQWNTALGLTTFGMQPSQGQTAVVDLNGFGSGGLFFFNDGQNGDVRSRPENLFPPVATNPRGPADTVPTRLPFNLAGDERVDTLRSAGLAKAGGIGVAGYAPLWQQRQYAHQHQASEDRNDFTPTILWHTLLVTDEQGDGEVSFSTSDAVTTWKVEADAHLASGETGRIGYGSRVFTTELPLQIEAKLPTEASAGDRLLIPIAAILKDAKIPEVRLGARMGDGLTLGANAPTKIELDNNNSDAGRGRALLPIEVGDKVGPVAIEIAARAGRFVDRIRHVINVAPRGFPHYRAAGGRISEGNADEWQLVIPEEFVANSGEAVLKIYPSPIAALTEGLEGILREPHGCFEQASSSNYPNTLVLNLIEANGDDIPVVAARARQLLPKGYAKITGYECQEKGYEWFGHDPGHEALTAYGLLQFHDMANVYDVDMSMVDRTKRWLMNRRDGKGNYPHPKVDHHSFGGRSPSITNAYVTYALLQAGTSEHDLKVEIDALVKRLDIKDPYELALIACALNLTERPEAATARRRLANLQQKDGSLPGAESSITMSGGRDLLVETAGFAVLAWLPDGSYAGNVRRAVEYLQTARNGRGTFGATQATIVALRAMTAYAIEHRSMLKDGIVRIYEEDTLLAERTFSADDLGAMTFDLWDKLTPGAHTLRLQIEGGGTAPMPWAGEVRYHAELPANDPNTATSITTQLRQNTVQEGATVALDVVVENVSDDELPTPMAIIGLPAGLDLATSVVEDLQRADQFAFWELKGRELILYWRKMDAGAKHELTFDLTARIPGTSKGPASRTYLYYTPDQKRWTAPIAVEVTAAK